MLPSVLLIIIFWALVPGFLTGWMLRERGKRFWPGVFVGFALGPFGVLAALAYIYVDDRRRAGRPGRAFRVFYDLPVVGRLHVSTVWALAGVLTFVCVWVLGGLWYETYRDPQGATGRGEQADKISPDKQLAQAGAGPGAQTAAQQEAQKSEANLKGTASPVPPSHLLGGLVGQTAQPTQAPAGQERAAGQNAPTQNSTTPVAPGFSASSPLNNASINNAAAPGTAPAPASPPTPAPATVSAHAREAVVAEVARSLAAAGHRVHASLSGDAQTATLSLSGATLTRGAGNQIIGGRLRHSLKAAGVRIVVMVNGQESWTYML